MADRNRQAERKNSIPVQALVCLLAMAAPCGLAWAAAPSAGFAPASYIGEFDPNLVWELLFGGIAVISFLVAIGIWILTALRGAKSAQLRRSAFISSALNTLNQGVMMTNAQNRVVFCNDRFLEMYGLSRAEISSTMTGRELAELRRTRGLLNLTVDEFSKLARRPEGVVTELPGGRSVLSKIFNLPNGGTIGTHEDCTEQRQLSRKLASTTKFLESVLDNVPVCVAAKNIEDGRYIFANRAFERFSRFSRDHIVGKRADEIFRPDTAAAIVKADESAINAKEGYFRNEFYVERGSQKRILASNRVIARNETGEPQYLIKTHEDVTDRRQTESRMAHMAYHDGLTDLPNRAAFLQALAQMIEACADTEEEFAVLCVDLDGLKEINDVFGHAMGDKLLIEVAGRIQACARGGVVARLSGDEFGMIIDGKQPEAGKALAEKLAQTLSDEFVNDGKSVRTGVTTGISVFPHNGSEAASLLANSGAALFRAKQKSRGSISIFAPEMDQQIRDRPALQQELSMAIRTVDMSLYYQPQAASGATVAASKIIGFEALARWKHPVRGFVSPGEFIPLAEERGLIVELGVWILREACREAASWPVPMQIAVNLSPAQFMHGA